MDGAIIAICGVLPQELHNYGWNASAYGGIQQTLPAKSPFEPERRWKHAPYQFAGKRFRI